MKHFAGGLACPLAATRRSIRVPSAALSYDTAPIMMKISFRKTNEEGDKAREATASPGRSIRFHRPCGSASVCEAMVFSDRQGRSRPVALRFGDFVADD